MKNQQSILMAVIILLCFGLVNCSDDSTSNTMAISFYNSDLQKITALSPLDTLYVEIRGLGLNKYYSVAVEDPDGNVISKLEVPTDGNGNIQRTPLWYDTGLKIPDTTSFPPSIDITSALSEIPFAVRITSLDDNILVYQQNLFFITPDFSTDSKPRPVVSACYQSGDQYYPENAFEETGSLDASGDVSLKTKIYADVKRIPWFADGEEVTAVDIHIVPFDGEKLDDHEDILAAAVISRTDVPVASENSVTKQLAVPELIWDLNGETTLINPGENNCAYRMIIDVNRNGTFDYGTDLNGDGKTDLYTDGIDGNSEPGFIVLNTPANEVFVKIRNGATSDHGEVNSLYEASSNADEQLFLFMDNLPTNESSVRIYVTTYTASAPADGTALSDIRSGSFSTATVSFPDENDLRFMPYIEGAGLLNTSLADDYSYASNIAADTKFSILVDVNQNGRFDSEDDIFLSDTTDPPAFVLVLAEETNLDTYTSEAGTSPTRTFEETGSGNGNSIVWVDVSGTATNDVTLNLFAKQSWSDGDSLSSALLTTAYSGGDDRYEFWNLDGDVQVKNPDSVTGQHDIVVDYGNDGMYNAGADLVVTVSIIDTQANDLPRVQYSNVASTGKFNSGTYGYEDTFLDDASDTHSSSYVSRGIKAIWNPYIKQYNTAEGDTTRTLYQGNYVDLYIVSTSDIDLFDWADIVLTDAIDATGRHKTLPVQYSCGNGAGQQNIWSPTLTIGSFYVIIDVNQNGQIDEGTDIIDAVNKAGKTIQEDSSIDGFAVISASAGN